MKLNVNSTEDICFDNRIENEYKIKRKKEKNNKI